MTTLTLGGLKRLIAEAESQGATDATPVHAAGTIPEAASEYAPLAPAPLVTGAYYVGRYVYRGEAGGDVLFIDVAPDPV